MSATDPYDDPSPVLSPPLAGEVAGYFLRAVGPSRCALIGAALEHLLEPLRAAGCEVVHHDVVLPEPHTGDTVIAWAQGMAQREEALKRDAAVLMLVAPGEQAGETALWAEQAAASGWQRHTAQFALPGVSDAVCILLLARSGVDQEKGQTLLRASYHGLASALVRPGDAVLATDAADQTLWRILEQQSRYRWLGVLSERPASSEVDSGIAWLSPATWQQEVAAVDVVVTRLGHDGTDWAQELQDAHAALVRSGRLVLLVPLDDGHHAQERAVLEKLSQLGLQIDRGWWQRLGRPVGVDQFLEVPRDGSGNLLINPECRAEADALVLLAVKTAGTGVNRQPDCALPNIIAFQRDYLDASVVRLIVADGLRLHSVPLRRQLARQVMADTPADSADHGAALCVLLYDPVALHGEDRSVLLEAAARYIETGPANPTVLRWQVSITFAVAVAHHAAGELQQAALLYQRVLTFDVLAFSPLLGTKTTTAAARLGWIRFGRGDHAGARSAWAQGLDEARRLSAQPDWSAVVGDPQAPETFAMPEFAAVMDEAGCLAAALRLTGETPLRPGLAWQWANRSWRAQLAEMRAEQQRRQRWQEDLQEAKDWLDGQYHQLNNEVRRRAEVIVALEADNAGIGAAYRLAHQRATAERLDLEQQLRLADEQLREAHDTHRALVLAQQTLLTAAQELSSATGNILGDTYRTRFPAESIAAEMSRLAAALNRLPCKGLVRTLLRLLVRLLGRQ